MLTQKFLQRLYRWLRSEGTVQWHVTHVGQNARYEASVADRFVVYVNKQIASGNFGPPEIVNIDQTTIELDKTGSIPLQIKDHVLSLRSTRSLLCCTVLLGVTLSGKTLPPFFIIKGKPNGWIACKWTGTTEYLCTSIYVVQDKARIHKRTFLLWTENNLLHFSSLKKPCLYLITNKITVHFMKLCLNVIQDCGTEVDFIVQGRVY